MPIFWHVPFWNIYFYFPFNMYFWHAPFKNVFPFPLNMYFMTVFHEMPGETMQKMANIPIQASLSKWTVCMDSGYDFQQSNTICPTVYIGCCAAQELLGVALALTSKRIKPGKEPILPTIGYLDQNAKPSTVYESIVSICP